jgi:tRNA(adenine34) deaminase
MCAGASMWTHLSQIVYAARDEKKGFLKISRSILHPKTILVGGIMEKECAELMQEFFRKKR